MMLIVTGVGALIVGYSIGYMDGEDEERRYFAYMALFVFSMLLLVQGGNLLMLLVGWGLVGLSSYLLIGFYHQRPEAVAAAKKAFIMNAFGDATMALAFFLLIQRTGSLSFQSSFDWAGGETGTLGGQPRRARPARRRRRQVGAASAPDLAPGRDGGPDPGQRPHPRGDDGHRRRLPARPHRADLRGGEARPGARRWPRRRNARPRRADRPRPDGHQARDRVLDDVPDRLHVPRRGARRLRERDVPAHGARLLQGAALPRRRNRHPRARRRAGHAPDGRAQALPAEHVLGVPDRGARAGRDPAALRVLREGLDPRLGPRRGHVRPDPVRRRRARHVPDRPLRVPHGLPRLRRRAFALRAGASAPARPVGAVALDGRGRRRAQRARR